MWSLTAVQIGADLEDILESNPKFVTSRAKLVGRQALQYGVTPDVVDAAISMAFVRTDLRHLSAAREALHQSLIAEDQRDDLACPIPLDRIVIGDQILTEDFQEACDDSFQLTTGLSDRKQELQVLMPQEGVTALYTQHRSHVHEYNQTSGHTIVTRGGRMERHWNVVTTSRYSQVYSGIINILEV